MKEYTLKDIEKFERTKSGIILCPSGDYTGILSFAEGCRFARWCSFVEGCSFAKWCSFAEGCSFARWCSFAKWCSFAERCSFAEWCSFAEGCSFENKKMNAGYPFIRANGIGSRNDGCTIFNCVDGLYVRCGCWVGTAEDFLEQVNKVHANNVHGQVYRLAVEMARIQFEKGK